MKIQGEQKRTNYKMYKDGKKWIFACALVGGLMIGGTTIAQADSTTDPTISTTTSVTTETNAPQPGDVITEYIPASYVNPAATNETVVDYYQGQNNNYSQNTDGTYTPLTDTEQAAVNAASNAGATSTTYSTDLNAISSAVDAQAPSIADDGQNYKVETVTDTNNLPADVDSTTNVAVNTTTDYTPTANADENSTLHIITQIGEAFYNVVQDGTTFQFVPMTAAELTELQNATTAGAVETVSFTGTQAELLAAYEADGYTSDGFKLITVTDSADVPEGRTFIDLSTVSETTYEYPVVDSEDRGFEIKNILKDGGSYYSYITADDGTVTKTELLIADDQLAAFEA